MPDRADGGAFLRRAVATVRVDTPDEAEAYLLAYPPPAGRWQVSSRLRVAAGERTEDHVGLRSAGDGDAMVRFDITSFANQHDPTPRTDEPSPALDGLMRRAVDFALSNGPHHPGSLARFPVPSLGYPGRVEVPLAILAVDQGRRGLYAPARVVVVRYPGGEPEGVGEFPGFDPDDWPPRRLGDWPPASVRDLDPVQLRAIVTRFSACWGRLLGAWLHGHDYAQRADEAVEARDLLARLDTPAMAGVYERLNPAFWRWLGEEANGVRIIT